MKTNKPKPPPKDNYHPETIARRERELEALGIPLTYLKAEGQRVVERPTAVVNLAGFTLGKLYLKWQADPKTKIGVNENEYKAGEAFADLVREHSKVMDYELKRSVQSPQWVSIGRGLPCIAEPDEDEMLRIMRIKHKFKMCWDDLTSLGWSTIDLVSMVCIENVPVESLTERNVYFLRQALRKLSERLC
jgi:hypothetical protein